MKCRRIFKKVWT